jgi:hypothetical protein
MKRTQKLTRKQIKNAQSLLEDVQDKKPTRRNIRLAKALRKEVKRQEANAPKGTKATNVNPMFSLARYLQRKEEKKHAREHGHHHHH